MPEILWSAHIGKRLAAWSPYVTRKAWAWPNNRSFGPFAWSWFILFYFFFFPSKPATVNNKNLLVYKRIYKGRSISLSNKFEYKI